MGLRGDLGDDQSQPANGTISNTFLKFLTCPDDITVTPGTGALSYVANAGFVPSPYFPYVWEPSTLGGAWSGYQMNWGGPVVAARLGVMLQGYYPENNPLNLRTTTAGIVDGTATTVAVTENILAGFSVGSPLFSGLPVVTNWACPYPNLCTIWGSQRVCGPSFNCLGGIVQPSEGTFDGAGWVMANTPGAMDSINYAWTSGITMKGVAPFPNSGHPGAINVLFCDGSVHSISKSVDGLIWAKALTPAGSILPVYCRQMPLGTSDLY